MKGSTGNSEESESLLVRMAETQRNRKIWQALTQCEIVGVEKQDASHYSQKHLPQIIKSIPDFGVAIDNMRVQKLLGILSTDGKVKLESIPSEVKDRSMFSCERYQFFLDAPFEISQKCCSVMKKEPFARYHKETGRVPITAQMASESRLRTQIWLKNGCNAFEATKKISNPMSFWTEQDVLLYIYQNKIPIASVYGEIIKENEVEGQLDMADLEIFDLGRPTLKTTGCQRTGCVLCGYGAHREKAGEGRFERLKETHPNMYKALDRATNSGVTMREAIDWTNEHGNLNIRY